MNLKCKQAQEKILNLETILIAKDREIATLRGIHVTPTKGARIERITFY
jgi:hypothetical protein